MNEQEQEIKNLLLQLLDGQKQILKEMREINQNLKMDRLKRFKPKRRLQPKPDERRDPQKDIPPLTRASEAKQIWSKVCDIVQDRISRPSYDTWFKATEPLGIYEETLYVSCANDFVRDWLSNRYDTLVQECIDMLETDLKKVEFV